MRHKSMLFIAAGAFVGWVGGGAVLAQEATGDAPPAQHEGAATPSASASKLITTSAKVESVNLDKHELSLKAAQGKPFTISVPESVNRLDNVKQGDTVKVAFYESVAVSLQKPGAAPIGEQSKTMGERTPGALPGGMAAQQITTTAKITKLEPANHELVIENPAGQTNTVRVSDPQVRAQLKSLKVGDKIQATYTVAMATSVVPKKAM